MSAVGLSIGGCAYQMRVRTEHAASIAALSSVLALRSVSMGRFPHPVVVRGYDYMHTSNLPQGRAQWLRRQIADVESDLALSMDADTWPRDPWQLANALYDLDRDLSWAIALAPVRQGGGEICNLRWLVKPSPEGNPEDIDESESAVYRSWRRTIGGAIDWHNLAATSEIGAGGFGLAVFNLRWFRQHWPEPAPEHAAIDTGEDIEMCLSTRRRGGVVRILRVDANHAEFVA